MIDTSGQPAPPQNALTAGAKVRDVADFHLRWAEFRPLALAIGRKPGLSGAESDTLGWMIELLDRIGPQDFEDGKR